MRWLCVCSLLLLVSASRANWIEDMVAQLGGLFHSYEEAPSNVIAMHNGYEERSYPARKWVCSEEKSTDGTVVMERLFWRIFRYISGENMAEAKIPMTVPVTTEFTAMREENNFKMCFFVPEKFQENPPAPTNPKIVVALQPEMTVFTRTVGGYMTTASDWLTEAASLSKLVEADGGTVSLVHMFWAGYDAPLKFWRRRNEVWFPKA
ncbi:heme-binding protein 2-like [Penaeus japonicus]|uniref:heme-binding protein 2-like n=1 Tax=Penaeus japonicus TaxID=27405 RepID=UPI001C70D2D0|nr:heme-binding protein 2-like [Penaeus japonicus]